MMENGKEEKKYTKKVEVPAAVQAGMTLDVYFRKIMPGYDKYKAAYLVAQYQKVVKTADEWAQELKTI